MMPLFCIMSFRSLTESVSKLIWISYYEKSIIRLDQNILIHEPCLHYVIMRRQLEMGREETTMGIAGDKHNGQITSLLIG